MDKVGKPRVVVVGAGFGGLWAARTLAREPVEILVIDRNNYHTFLALLYQVAAAELEPEDIAYPVRSIFRNLSEVDFALAYVRRIDIEKRIVKTDNQEFLYDYLIGPPEAYPIRSVCRALMIMPFSSRPLKKA
jgi:NADH dehydrogenase